MVGRGPGIGENHLGGHRKGTPVEGTEGTDALGDEDRWGLGVGRPGSSRGPGWTPAQLANCLVQTRVCGLGVQVSGDRHRYSLVVGGEGSGPRLAEQAGGR